MCLRQMYGNNNLKQSQKGFITIYKRQSIAQSMPLLKKSQSCISGHCAWDQYRNFYMIHHDHIVSFAAIALLEL